MRGTSTTYRHLWKIALAAVIGGLLIAAGSIWPSAPSGEAGATILGVDAIPDASNTANSLGTIDDCREVNVGDTFDVDVFIQNADDLKGWDVRFGFDASILSLRDPSYNLDGFFAPGLDASAYEGNGVLFLSAGSASPGVGPSGSGVLARVHLHALTPGVSEATIKTTPLPPYLAHSQSPAEYHTNPILNARIAVGQSCSGAPTLPPTPTAPPTLAPTPSPTPSPTPAPTGTVGGATGTPTPAPTFTPVPGTIPWGDIDCSGAVDIQDAVYIAMTKAGTPVSPIGSPCPVVGDVVFGAVIDVNWGDFDCSGQFEMGDAIAIMRHLIGLGGGVADCPHIATNYVSFP